MFQNEKKLFTILHHAMALVMLCLSSLAVTTAAFFLTPQYDVNDLLTIFICTGMSGYALGTYDVVVHYLEKDNQELYLEGYFDHDSHQ